MNRYTRDQLITIALDMVNADTLNRRDRPNGTIVQEALSIKWLQQALDMAHHMCPFSADIASVSMSISASSNDITLASDGTTYLPSDFILDVKHGLTYSVSNGYKRIYRKGFQDWLSLYNQAGTQTSQYPKFYTIVQRRIKITPIPSSALTATLWYYSCPSVVANNANVNFPLDWPLIEFLRLRAKEWLNAIAPGSAEKYLIDAIAKARAAGLLNETEYEQMPIEDSFVIDNSAMSSYGWLGDQAPRT